jgi:hypothetical protein
MRSSRDIKNDHRPGVQIPDAEEEEEEEMYL